MEENNLLTQGMEQPRNNRSMGDSFSRVQAELQGANFEKNRLKETIKADE